VRRLLTALILIAPFLLPATDAQIGPTLSGIVREIGTGNVVSEAAVAVVGGKANQDVTDSAGKFSLRFPPDVKVGTVVRVRVTKIGYEPYDQSVSISELALDILLTKTRKKPSLNPQSPPTLQGRLIPSNEKTPENSCPTLGTGGIFILIGFATSYVERFPHTVVMVDDQPRLTVHRETDGKVWVALDIFGADGKIIATLDEDGFTVRQGSYFKMRQDKHSLRIVDEYNAEVLNVRYVNPSAIWVNALLRYPGSKPVSLKGSNGGGMCSIHSGTADINIRTVPRSTENNGPLSLEGSQQSENHGTTDTVTGAAQHHGTSDTASTEVHRVVEADNPKAYTNYSGYGNLRDRTLYLAAMILNIGKMRVSGYPDFGPDRNANAAADTNWMHYNYEVFMHNFDEQLHSIQREYATHLFALPGFDYQLKSIDEGRQSPAWTHMMGDHDFCIWVDDLNQLAKMLPPDGSAHGPIACDLRHK
jgi:hypothetical protein